MSDVAVRPLDVLDDAEFATAYDVFARAEKHGREYGSVVGAEPLRTMLTRPTPMWARTAWAAWRGMSIVGVATLTMPLSDNQHLGFGAVSVDPRCRRAGVGGALLDKVEDGLRRAGRRTGVFEVSYPAGADGDWPGTAFAKSRGYAMALHEAHQVLDLPATIDLDVPARDGYRVVSWRGRCPDEWAEAYCRLMATFHDQAPTGALDTEASEWTVERLRETEADMAARGKRFFVSAGVSPEGELVGYTELGGPAGNPDAHQDETLVDPAHRGHGLGLALKAANLALLQTELPDRTLVHTFVSPTNAAMNAVNTALGFRPVEYCDEWQRDLSA